MKNLGKSLRKAIEQSGYSIYKVANKSGVNRTTLQKILSNERSASLELLKQVLFTLKLSPTEEEEILTIFEISQSGESLYAQRQLIKQFLEDLFHIDKSPFHMKRTELTGSHDSAFDTALCGQKIISGIYQVEELIGWMLERECQNADPHMDLNVPGDLPIVSRLFYHSFLSASVPSQLAIRHITRFSRTVNADEDSLSNLKVLIGLLPFSLTKRLDYQIHYFYDNHLSSEPLYCAFPYYILFSDTLILLSAEGNVALPCTDHSTILHFHYLFEDSMRKTQPLVDKYSSPSEFLEYLLQADADDTGFNTIEHMPCLATFIPEELYDRYARAEIPNREMLIQSAIHRSRQLAALENRCCIFSKQGLLEFASTGAMADIPLCYVLPFSIPDRILVLERMYHDLISGTQEFRMTNPISFPLPPHLLCTIRNNIGVEFCYVYDDEMLFKHIHVREHTILDAFEDFMQYAVNSQIIYSREETIQEVLQCIRDLQKK